MERPKLTGLKDKSILEYIESLEAQLKTPYAEAFLSLKKMVDRGNAQVKGAEMDIFSPEGETKFKQAAKFSSQLKDWYSEMEYFKSKMSPEELEMDDGVIAKKSLEKKVGVAEKMALNKQDGKNTSI